MNRPRKLLKIRAWIGISFFSAVLLVLTGFILLFIQHTNEQENNAWVIHTYQVINKLEKIESLLVDVETGCRGYVATGDSRFLHPYEVALRRLPSTMLALHQLVTDNAGQLQQARLLEQLVNDKLDFESQLTRITYVPATTAVLFTGKQRMDAVRRQLSTMTEVEERLMRIRGRDMREAYRRTNGLTLMLTVLATVAFGLSYLLNQREAKRRQWAETTLRASEKRFRSLVDQLETVVFQADLAGSWTYLNPAWQLFTGFSVEESLGTFFMDYVLPEDRAQARVNFEQILNGQQVQAKHVIRFRNKTGGYRWFEALVQAVRDDENTMKGAVGLLTDITDRKQAEEALIESEQRFRQIAENVDEIFWIRDIQASRFLYINPAYEKFTGLSPEPLYEDSAAFLSIVLAEDRTIVEKAFRDQDLNITYQFRTFHQDGSLRWLRTKALGIKNEQGVLVRRIGIATDITLAIEKEQILQESLVNERLLNGLKSQFISIASHEFRTPLMSISSSTELVRYYVDREKENTSTPLISKHLNAIVNQIAGLNDLINDTLVISKAEEGKIQVILEDVDLIELSQLLTASTFTDREDGRKVELSVTGIAGPVCIDRKLMTHVLSNLLSNAFKFSTGTVELGLSFSPTDVRMVVRDTGIGIPAKDLPYLFGKFFRASNASHIQGTGLGLAICQEYMSLQQGSLEVVSKEGVGTTFTVILPRV